MRRAHPLSRTPHRPVRFHPKAGESATILESASALAGAGSVPGCAGSGCCTPFCDLGDDTGCLEGQTCQPLYPNGQAPLECVAEVGVCALP